MGERKSSVETGDGALIVVRAHGHIALRGSLDRSRYRMTMAELDEVSDILARLCGEIQVERECAGMGDRKDG